MKRADSNSQSEHKTRIKRAEERSASLSPIYAFYHTCTIFTQKKVCKHVNLRAAQRTRTRGERTTWPPSCSRPPTGPPPPSGCAPRAPSGRGLPGPEGFSLGNAPEEVKKKVSGHEDSYTVVQKTTQKTYLYVDKSGHLHTPTLLVLEHPKHTSQIIARMLTTSVGLPCHHGHDRRRSVARLNTPLLVLRLDSARNSTTRWTETRHTQKKSPRRRRRNMAMKQDVFARGCSCERAEKKKKKKRTIYRIAGEQLEHHDAKAEYVGLLVQAAGRLVHGVHVPGGMKSTSHQHKSQSCIHRGRYPINKQKLHCCCCVCVCACLGARCRAGGWD